MEDSNSTVNAIGKSNTAWVTAKADQYTANGVLGLGYKAGSWSVKLVGGYDSIVEEGAIKARIDADFGVFKAFLMGGWNTDGSSWTSTLART